MNERMNLTRREFLGGAAAAGLTGLSLPGFGAEAPKQGPAAAAKVLSPEDIQKIEAALPAAAVVKPRRARRLLIFDLNVGYPGHPSAMMANEAFTRLGRKTGAFETVVSRDPAVFKPESLRTFDAVFLNNTVGNLFTDPALRQSLIDFVYGGGGLMGVHGTSVAFTWWPLGAVEDWPEFALMLGMRGAFHRANTEHAYLKLDDPENPLNAPFGGKGFEYRDEFFRPQGTYSRRRVRVLFSFDNEKMDLAAEPHDRGWREDGDYAMAWVRHYGRGRVFYCSFAHQPALFQDPLMLRFYLGAAQFALGDLEAPTIPSARVSPAIRAQEKLGWRLALGCYTFNKGTLFEAIDKTSRLGVPYLGAISFQKVSAEIPKNLEPGLLSEDELRQVRLKLDAAGVRLLTYYFHRLPGEEAECRKVFEFARRIGAETIVAEPQPEALDTIEKFCEEYDINVALHNHDQKMSPNTWNPEGVLKMCAGRGRRIGACPDLGFWIRSGIDPLAGLRALKDRLIGVDLHDLDAATPAGHDVPWGTGIGKTAECLKELRRLGVRPPIGLEYAYNFEANQPEVAQCVKFFNQLSLKI